MARDLRKYLRKTHMVNAKEKFSYIAFDSNFEVKVAIESSGLANRELPEHLVEMLRYHGYPFIVSMNARSRRTCNITFTTWPCASS